MVLIKPHPLTPDSYLSEFNELYNLSVTDKPLDLVLSMVGNVYVTYSSVGLEARLLGLTVHVVNIPGYINESPLIPRNFSTTTLDNGVNYLNP